MQRLIARTVSAIWAVLFLSVFPAVAAPTSGAIIPNLPASPLFSVSTIPANGDVNPYGVAFVPKGFPGGGATEPGDILVSNFNNSGNLQGTGTTIVSVSPKGSVSQFFQGLPGLGLTTALGVLSRGFVIVGSLPATYDSSGNLLSVQPGGLLILDKSGNLVGAISNTKLLDGPWDLTVADYGDFSQIFVSDVLSGTVTRLDVYTPNPHEFYLLDTIQIASGYMHEPNSAALVVGPTGLVYDPYQDLLYVASTGDNAIFVLKHAGRANSDKGMGQLVYTDSAHLRGPLALAQAPNGDLLTANGDAENPDPSQPSEIVEFTPAGQFVDQFSVDPAQGGAFGIAIMPVGYDRVIFAAVDDNKNVLDVWHVHT